LKECPEVGVSTSHHQSTMTPLDSSVPNTTANQYFRSGIIHYNTGDSKCSSCGVAQPSLQRNQLDDESTCDHCGLCCKSHKRSCPTNICNVCGDGRTQAAPESVDIMAAMGKLEKSNGEVDTSSYRVPNTGSSKSWQQLDIKGGTIYDIGGHQINIVVNNPPSTSDSERVEDMDGDVNTVENTDVDPELDEYMSLEEYVMIGSATNPIAMNAGICLTDIEHITKSSAETIIAKKKSFPYSLFSKGDPASCGSPVHACPT